MVKKSKDGRTYDTETATLVHYREGCGGDRYQGLYQRRDGEFFFWEYDNGEGWGNIDPATDEAAYKWVEEHAPHLLVQYFPTVLPKVVKKIMERSYQRSRTVGSGTRLSSGARQVTATFPQHLYDKLKLAAEKKEVAASEMVRQCVASVLGGPEVVPE